ncbi:hypothetical protein EPUL_002156, partial [Erysiphe pulchra]
MASLPGSTYYLSPLDKFLNDDEVPISWKSVSSILINCRGVESEYNTVRSFLGDKDVLNILFRPYSAFPFPSTETKELFEKKSALTEVVSSHPSHKDIKEIKEDTLWLSKEANLDEISALRIVLLECHARNSNRLLGPFSDEEVANLQEATGKNKFSNSVSQSFIPHGLQPATIREHFEKVESRKQRILKTYLSERRSIWVCAEKLLQIFFKDKTNKEMQYNNKQYTTPLWLKERAKDFGALLQSANKNTIILSYISATRDHLQKLGSESGFFKQDGGCEEIEMDWVKTQVTEATLSLKILYHLVLHEVKIPSSQVVLEWYQLLQSFDFFDKFGSVDAYFGTFVIPLQALSSVISVIFLENLDPSTFLNNPDKQHQVSSDHAKEDPFILNSNSIISLHTIILQAADSGLIIAGPAILAWSILLQSMSFCVDTEKETAINEGIDLDHSHHTLEMSNNRQDYSQYENILQRIQSTVVGDVVDYLARRAVNVCHVFDIISEISDRLGSSNDAIFPDIGPQMRNQFLILIRKCISMGYIPEIVCAIISVLNGGCGYWEIVNSTSDFFIDCPAVRFLNDDLLVEAFLGISQSRFPYELLPFLQIVRALASSSSCIKPDHHLSILRSLEVMPVFTHLLPTDFVDYETTLEEDNNNTVILTGTVHLFEPRNKNFVSVEKNLRSMSMLQVDQDFVISAGTLGRIISESGPRVACWFHQYSALKYFGKLLETFLAASDQVDGTTGKSASPESVSEIIEVFAVLIHCLSSSTDVSRNGVENANQLLEIASSGLSRNRDIITVIFDIFEERLQNNCGRLGNNFPLQLLISCVHFIHAILPLYPYRVWPMLAKSGLLGLTKNGESLSTIVEGIERPTGRFDFLLSCTYLFKSLLHDVTRNALRRKIIGRPPFNFTGVQNVSTGSPDQFITKILLFFSKYLVEVLENSCMWKYQSDDDRRSLNYVITSSFEQILQYCYGIESNFTTSEIKSRPIDTKGNVPLMGVLMPSAAFIVESFLSTSSGNLRFQPLLQSFLNGLDSSQKNLFFQQSCVWKKHIISALTFSKTLLRVGAYLKRPASQFEKLVFNSSPLIARIYCSDDDFSIPVINLLESLVYAATSHEPEPPSLLGHLGPYTARNFLRVLSNLDKPLSRSENLNRVWHFLGVVVSSRQQWFSNYLLTGKTPRDALTNKSSEKESTTLEKSFLTTALQALIKVTEASDIETLSILEFLSLAQNFWPWTVCNAPLYLDFIKSILNYLNKLTPPQLRQSNVDIVIRTCCEIRMASSIAEILAMHLFHSRQTGTSVAIKDILPNLKYYERFGVIALNYNSSLHGLLKQNFEARYPGCSPNDFKRSVLYSQSFERDYFYDIGLANKMLNLDQAWSGRNGDDGIRGEFDRSNANLSLVDAQIAFFHSWKFLSLELCGWISTEPQIRRLFCKVITDCLIVNCKAQPPEEIFFRLTQTRAEFALVLTQRLLQSKSEADELDGLLEVVWMTICELRGGFERPVPESDISYYRSLLKLLYLTICVHSDHKTATEEDFRKTTVGFPKKITLIPLIIEIIKYVVSHGMSEIATSIHEPAAQCSPEDLVLLTGIFQSCLRIWNISSSHPQIASILISDGAINIALRLFSWSDRLAIDGDPIYGELSILFLLELSSIPIMAEQLAIEGFLTQISSSNLMLYFQNEKLGLATDAGSRRCYNIWVRSLLPLLLNVIYSLEQSVAIEVAQFLCQYPALLRQSERVLEAPLINRLIDNGPKRYITLLACSEVHSLALIIFILNRFRENMRGKMEIPPVNWDSGAVLEHVEFWLGSRALLRDRLLPTSDREIEMMKLKEESSEAINQLEEKVIAQLVGIKDILEADGNENEAWCYSYRTSSHERSNI